MIENLKTVRYRNVLLSKLKSVEKSFFVETIICQKLMSRDKWVPTLTQKNVCLRE